MILNLSIPYNAPYDCYQYLLKLQIFLIIAIKMAINEAPPPQAAEYLISKE